MDPIEALRMRGFGGTKRFVGDAQPGDVRAGKTFTNALGNDKVGQLTAWDTEPQTITPGTTDIIKPAGIYDGNITIQGAADLVPANIVEGKSIFGVVGTNNGKRSASGTVTSSVNSSSFSEDGTNITTPYVTVTGLAFTPRMILVYDGNKKLTIYSPNDLLPTNKIAWYNGNSTSAPRFIRAIGNAYVNNSGFQLPVTGASTLFNWIAFE